MKPTPAPDSAALMLGPAGIVILRRFLMMLALVCVLSSAHSLWNPVAGENYVGAISGLAIATLAYLLLRRGWVMAAVHVALWGMTCTILVLPFLVAGIRTPALFLLPGLCMFAAWLVGARVALAVFAISSIVLVMLVVAEVWWGYTPPAIQRTSFAIALVIIPSILISLLIAVTAINGYQTQLAQVVALTHTLQNQLSALQLSEDRFSALFRANPTPSSTVDEGGRHLEVNDAWVAMFGFTEAQARGKTTHELGLWGDPAVRDLLLREMQIYGKVVGVATELNTATGLRPFLIYVSPVETTGQGRLVTSLLDQSDRLAMEAAHKQNQAELEARVALRTTELQQTLATLKAAQNELVQAEKLASLGAMVAGISHELNTPIGNTLTVASTLHDQVRGIQTAIKQGELRRSTLDGFLEGLEEMSGLITRSTTRAAQLIQSFKQVAVDRTTEQRREFALRELCVDIAASVKAGMRKKLVDITIDVPADLRCDSHPGPLGQVLTNLIQNAMLHAFGERTDGRIMIHAALDARGPTAMVVMTVTDDGVGMNDHTRSHAFDPFFTTRLGQGGSGLGLSVSHTIAVTTLQGSLSVAPAPGSGCCFTLRMAQQVAQLVA